MKYYLKINQDIETNVDYKLEGRVINVEVNDDCDLEIEMNNDQYQLKIVFGKGVKVNLTKYLSCSHAKVIYQIAKHTQLNEFVIIEQDNLAINYVKDVSVLKNAVYEVSNAFFGDSDIICDVNINLDGINAQALHNIAVISRKSNEKNFNITINNNESISVGELNNFGVVKDKAVLKFNGTGYIKKGAKMTQAHQESKIITFDPQVVAEANPYLIIDEADVEASHAAAVGKMDEEQLYYLQSRGISFDEAAKLITYGYLKPILMKIKDEASKEKLENLIETKVVL